VASSASSGLETGLPEGIDGPGGETRSKVKEGTRGQLFSGWIQKRSESAVRQGSRDPGKGRVWGEKLRREIL